jgi:uncharacterized membrane protein YfcA
VEPVQFLAPLAVFLVGLSKGGLPMVGMLSVPLLALAMPPMQAAMLLLPLFVASDAVGVWLYRREFSAPNLRILLPSGLAGVVLGWALATRVSDRAIAALVGLIGLAYCLNVWFGRPPRARPARRLPGTFWGVVTGFTSFVAHAGSPPFQVYVLPQQLPKMSFAGTSTLLFAALNLAKLVAYEDLFPYSSSSLHALLYLLPWALAGTLAGAALTRRLPDAGFFRLVQYGLLAISLKLLWNVLFAP